MKFAREATTFVIPPATMAIAALTWSVYYPIPYLSGIGLAFAVLAVGILLFFRDPERLRPDGDNLALAPADGRILLSETLADGRKHVAIFMSVFNVHVNRCPVTGMITAVEDRPGKYFNAATDDAALKNARVTVDANTECGPASWIQISGLIARKISCRLKPGDAVEAGDRFGLIYFGSRMEVFLPASASPMVKPGDRVRAGETIIAKLSTEVSYDPMACKPPHNR